jgi:hypothetical protein
MADPVYQQIAAALREFPRTPTLSGKDRDCSTSTAAGYVRPTCGAGGTRTMLVR